MKRKFEILFLVENAIGNVLQVLYSLEYCLKNNINSGIFLNKVSSSFQDYLRECYGDDAVLTSADGVYTKNLVHTFTFGDEIEIVYENYFYICPDAISTKYVSETEQCISLVKSLYPSNHKIPLTLDKLTEDKTDRIRELNIENKYILYPGCASSSSVKRWPLFFELMELIGKDNVIFIGGEDDLNHESSYVYKRTVTKLFPRQLTNKKEFWLFCKKIYLLDPFAHNDKISKLENSYFNVFNWGELVSILRNCKGFIGNDGGLMHLAAAAGANGVAIFGPSSVNKNKPLSSDIKSLHKKYSCQPCQFDVAGVFMNKHFVSCPYQVKCLVDITCSDVINMIQDER